MAIPDLQKELSLQDPNAPMSRIDTISGSTPGGFQYADGGQASMQPPAPMQVQTPVPSPYTASAAAPTIAETLAGITNQAMAIQSQIPGATGLTKGPFQMPGVEDQSKYDAAFASGQQLTDKEEKAVKRDQLKMFQKEIDATNQIYDQMMREEQMRGQGRVGSTTAIGARAGILGSDFANTQQETVKDYNKQITNGISAERSAKIAGIMGTARKAAADEIAAKNTARKQGADALIEHYKSTADRKSQNITKIAGALISQGIDPSTLDEPTLADMAKQAGTTPEDIMFAYQSAKTTADAEAAKADLDTRKTESEIAKNGRMTVGDGDTLVDAQGNVIYNNPKNFAPTSDEGAATMSNGQTAFVGQPGYAKLTVKQKNQADSLNNLMRSLNEYKNYYDKNKGAFGGKAGNMFGSDSGQLETMFNSIIFAAAQAEGTGALQKPDREVIEKIVPNPTSFSGAANTLFKGGADANMLRIQNQIDKYQNNLRGYGLEAVLADPYAGSESNDTSISEAVDKAGYNYEAMKADGLSDDEIKAAINGN